MTGVRMLSMMSFEEEADMTADDTDDGRDVIERWRLYKAPVKRLSQNVMDQLASEPVSKEPGSRPILEAKWRDKPLVHLDFSDDMFELTTFRPRDFYWGGPNMVQQGGDSKPAGATRRTSRISLTEVDPSIPQMPVYKLESLDLSKNAITDEDFIPDDPRDPKTTLTGKVFASLESLVLTYNELEFPIIFMPNLRQLSLRQNRIVRFPPLAGLKKLETLDLSYNLIQALDEKDFEGIKELKNLSISDNRIQMMPSALYKVLIQFRDMLLSQLKLEDNPFCLSFSEYQSLVVWVCRSLQKLDDLNFETEPKLRKEMLNLAKRNLGDMSDEGFLRKLDIQVMDRQRKLDGCGDDTVFRSRSVMKPESTTKSVVPKATVFEDVVEQLDEALKQPPSNVKVWVTLAFNLASKLFKQYLESSGIVFMHKKSKAEEDQLLVTRFMVVVEDIGRRNLESRTVLVRLLGKLCAIPDRGLGEQCILALAHVAQEHVSASESKAFKLSVVEMLKEMVVPLLKASGLSVDVSGQVIIVLHTFLIMAEDMNQAMAEALTEVLGALCFMMAQDLRQALVEDGAASSTKKRSLSKRIGLTALMRCAVERPEIARLVLSKRAYGSELFIQLAKALVSKEEFTNDTLPPTIYRDWAGIFQACLVHAPQEGIELIADLHLHLDLFGKMASLDPDEHHDRLIPEIIEVRGHREDSLNPRIATRMGAIFDLMATLLTSGSDDAQLWTQLLGSPDVDMHKLKEVRVSPFMDALLWVPQWMVGDPVVLAASLRCLIVVLSNPAYMVRYLQLVSDKLGLCSLSEADHRIIPLITSKLKDLLRKCQDMSKDAASYQRTGATSQAPPPTRRGSLASRRHSLASGFNQRASGRAVVAPEQGAVDLRMVQDQYAFEVLAAIVDFIAFFAGDAKGMKVEQNVADRVRKIDDAMNKLGRDMKLMELLNVHSSKVRVAVAKCMKSIDVSQCSEAENKALLDMLAGDEVDPDFRQDEAVVTAILNQLQHFIEVDGKVADRFRADQGEEVLARVQKVLMYRRAETQEQVAASVQSRMAAVAVLMAASHRGNLRPYQRNHDMEMALQEELKSEEAEAMFWTDEPQPDICIELTWVGRSVSTLLGALPHLVCHQKRSFRVIHRIADVLLCVDDPPTMRDPPSAEDRAQREAAMWDAAAMKRQVMISAMKTDDEAERWYEDFVVQQQLFVTLQGYHSILTYLERGSNPWSKRHGDGEDNPLHQVAIHSKTRFDETQACEALLEQLRDIAGEEQRMEDQRKEDLIKSEEEEHIRLAVGEVSTHSRETHVLEVCMTEGWRDNQMDDVCAVRLNTLAVSVPTILRSQRPMYLAGMEERLFEPAYSVAAFLRSIYSVLVAPAMEQFRTDLIASLRVVSTQLRILAVVEQCTSLTCCNVAAKFLRIMSVVLRPEPAQAVVTDTDVILGVDVIIRFVGRCMDPLRPLLAGLGRGYALTTEQTALCKECLRMLACGLQVVLKVEFAPGLPAVNKQCILKLVDNMLPMSNVLAVCLCILYDMQLDHGTADGRYINTKFMRHALARQGIREYGLEVLSCISALTPKWSYEILEFFSRAEIMGKCRIRSSFLQELSKRLQAREKAAAVQSHMQHVFPDDHEMVLVRAEAKMGHQQAMSKSFMVFGGGAQFHDGSLVLTTHRLYFLGPPRGSRCGLCPPDVYCSLGPTVELTRSYSELTRIVQGEEQQTLILGWQVKSVRGECIGEKFDVFICVRSDIRPLLAQTLATLSGPTPPQRLLPIKDRLLKLAIVKRVSPPVICVSFGHRLIGKEERFSLFVLTQAEFCEYQVEFENWKPPWSSIPVTMDDDDFFLTESEGQDGTLDDKLSVEKWAARLRNHTTPIQAVLRHEKAKAQGESNAGGADAHVQDRDSGNGCRQAERGRNLWDNFSDEEVAKMVENRERAMKATKMQEDDRSEEKPEQKELKALNKALSGIFKQLVFHELAQLQQVEFHAECSPALGLSFVTRGGKQVEDVVIRFMDDLAREHWRRGLSMVLSSRLRQWLRQ